MKLNILTKSYSEFWFFKIKVKLEDSLCKDSFKTGFLSKIPFFTQNFKCYVFVWRTSFKFNHHVVRIFQRLKIVLRSLLFIKQVGIKNVEFVSLNLFWRWLLLVMFLLYYPRLSVSSPIIGNSDSVNILWFSVSESALGIDR